MQLNLLMLCWQSMERKGCSRQHRIHRGQPHASGQCLWQRVLQRLPLENLGQTSSSAAWQGHETGWGMVAHQYEAVEVEDWAGHGLYMAHEC